jgi:hypothetical protein
MNLMVLIYHHVHRFHHHDRHLLKPINRKTKHHVNLYGD